MSETKDKLQTNRTVRVISRETDIHQSSVSWIISKDLYLKCFKRRSAQELTTDANCAARMQRAKLLLQMFPQYATDFVFFTDKKVFSVTSPDNRTEQSGRLRELLKKKLSVFFSAGTTRSAMPSRLFNVPVSRNFLNSLLTPRTVQLFSGNSSVNLFAVYPFKYKLCIKILSLSPNIVLIVDKRCSDASAVTNFRWHKLIAKVNK